MPGAKDQISSSDLNRRIQIQQNQYTWVDQNNRQDNWQTIYTCWANFVDRSMGRGMGKVYRYFQLYPEADRAMQIRFQKSVAVGAGDLNNKPMRVLYSAHGVNHVYQLLGVENPNEANVSLWLICHEVQAQVVN